MQRLNLINEDFFFGMNDRIPPHLLPKGVFQLIENALVGNNKIEKRLGTNNIADSLGAFAILGLSAFEPSGGTKRMIACLNGSANAQLYSWTGSGAFSAIGSANLTIDKQMNFIQASNYLFGFNGAEVVDYDGTTVTRNRSGVPQATFGVWFHNYLFTANTSSNPSRLQWSDLGDPITFTAANFFDVNPNDGDEITGLGIINDELYVFKKNSIWAITGWSGSTFSATTVAGQNTNSKLYGYGCVSHQSIVSTGKNLYYLSFLGNIPHIRNFNQTVFAETIEQGIVSYDMEDTLDGVNKSQLSKCAGVYDGRYIYWALQNGASTTNNLVIVLDPERRSKYKAETLRSWVKWTGITPSQYAVSTISGRAKVYFGDATTGGFVFEQGTSTYDDNGTAIDMDIRSKDYMFYNARKTKWKYIYLKSQTGSAGTLDVNARIEQAVDFTNQESISLVGNSPGLGPTGTFTLGVSVLGGSVITKDRVTLAHLTGTLLGIQFVEDSANSCEIYDYQILGFPRGLRESG